MSSILANFHTCHCHWSALVDQFVILDFKASFTRVSDTSWAKLLLRMFDLSSSEFSIVTQQRERDSAFLLLQWYIQVLKVQLQTIVRVGQHFFPMICLLLVFIIVIF